MDNKLVAAPMDVTANGLIYNKTLFDKAGVKVPTSPDEVWTWDEYIAALKQVMDKAEHDMAWFGMSLPTGGLRCYTRMAEAS